MYGKHAVFAAINNNNRNIEKIYCLEKTFLEFKNKLQNFKRLQCKNLQPHFDKTWR